MTTKPIVDCSAWQGDINFPLLISKTAGVIMRAGNGMFPDNLFPSNWPGLKDHPGLTGAYWYVKSGINGGEQAQKFHATLAASAAFPDVLVMDAEENGAGLSQSALRVRYKLFIDTLQGLRPAAEIVVYTRASFWNPNIGIAGWEKNYKLWTAHYGVENPAVPLAWNGAWWLHQFSADGNGLGEEYGVQSDDIDLNKLRVPVPDPPPPNPDPTPIPPPGDFPKSGTVSGAYGANLRTEPRVHSSPPPVGTLIKILPEGTALTLYAELLAVNGNDWYLVRVPSMSNLAGWVVKYLITVGEL